MTNVSLISTHVEILVFTRVSDPYGARRGWLAYVRCTLDGAVLKPLVLFRDFDRKLAVTALDRLERADGAAVDIGARFRGLEFDDPHVTPEARARIAEVVLAHATAKGIR